MSDKITPLKARQLIKKSIERFCLKQIPYDELSSKTVNFYDHLVTGEKVKIASGVFVTIHGYRIGSGIAEELEKIAKNNGFRLIFKDGKA